MNYRLTDSIRRHIASLHDPGRFIERLPTISGVWYPVEPDTPAVYLTDDEETDTREVGFLSERDLPDPASPTSSSPSSGRL